MIIINKFLIMVSTGLAYRNFVCLLLFICVTLKARAPGLLGDRLVLHCLHCNINLYIPSITFRCHWKADIMYFMEILKLF